MDKGKVVDIQLKENKFRKYATHILVFVILAAIPFSTAFAVGKYTNLEIFEKAQTPANASPTRPDWFVFEANQFTIEYPKSWEVAENSNNGPSGAKITGGGAWVEFWLKETRAYQFTAEQLSKQNAPKDSVMKVDNRDAKVKEFPYKDGSSFVVVEVAATEKLPKVTFWINAANEQVKKTALEIVSSYKTKIGTIH
jgi:hypothetical protein